jgi:hypothetical protein
MANAQILQVFQLDKYVFGRPEESGRADACVPCAQPEPYDAEAAGAPLPVRMKHQKATVRRLPPGDTGLMAPQAQLSQCVS